MSSLCAVRHDHDDDRDLLHGRFPYGWAAFIAFVALNVASTVGLLASLY
jgi:hypothetical protein